VTAVLNLLVQLALPGRPRFLGRVRRGVVGADKKR
jgi:hypothetical protein